MTSKSDHDHGKVAYGELSQRQLNGDAGLYARLRRRGVAGWIIKGAMALVLVGLLIGSKYGLHGLVHGSEPEFATTILGIALVFTGVLVPCVILLLSRRGHLSSMTDDFGEAEGQVARGLRNATVIRNRNRSGTRPHG